LVVCVEEATDVVETNELLKMAAGWFFDDQGTSVAGRTGQTAPFARDSIC